MKSISLNLIVSILAYYSVIVSSKENNKVLRLPINERSHSQQQPHNRKFHQRDGLTSSVASLYNANGKEYLVQVGVGTPPQYFNVTLDTGSTDFWIPSIACPIVMCPHTRFKAQNSSTFKSLPQTLNIEYGIGSAKGTYGADTVILGSTSLPNQTIGLVNNTNNILSASDIQDPDNGILGLGFPGLSKKSGSINFIMGLYQSKVISQAIFSIFLNSQFVYGNSGEIVLGGMDSAKYTGDIQYTPVLTYDDTLIPMVGNNSNNNGEYLYWTVAGQGVSTDDYTSNNTLRAFILDTGTTLTYVPEDIAKSIVMSVTNNANTTQFDSINGYYNIDCNLYDIQNVFVQFMISTSSSVVSTTPITINVPVSELVVPLDNALTPDTSVSCIFGIVPAPTGLGMGETWILGESTLRSVYAVYDLQQSRMGFANLAADASVNSTNINSSSSNNSSSESSVGGGDNGNIPAMTSMPSSAAGDSINVSSYSLSIKSLTPSYSLVISVLSLMFLYHQL